MYCAQRIASILSLNVVTSCDLPRLSNFLRVWSIYLIEVFLFKKLFETEKEDGPHTVKDIKLISAGRILENNRTVGECRSPLCDITTMHVVVQQHLENGSIRFSSSCQSFLWKIKWNLQMLLARNLTSIMLQQFSHCLIYIYMLQKQNQHTMRSRTNACVWYYEMQIDKVLAPFHLLEIGVSWKKITRSFGSRCSL